MKKLTFIIVDIVITAAIAGGIFYYYSRTRAPEPQTQTPAELKGDEATRQELNKIVDSSVIKDLSRQAKATAVLKSKCSTTLPSADTSRWQAYRDQKNGFELCYPDDLIVIHQAPVISGSPIVFMLDFPSTYSTGTNLSYAGIGVRVQSGVCTLWPGWQPQASVTRNGITFQISKGSEGAAGSFLDFLRNATERNTSCYDVTLQLHYSNLDIYRDIGGLLPPGAPKDFDRKKIEEIFEQVMSTFKFI